MLKYLQKKRGSQQQWLTEFIIEQADKRQQERGKVTSKSNQEEEEQITEDSRDQIEEDEINKDNENK